ncbi:MAG: XapX domain-containing protein [Sphingopyxis sp.]|nr:XapX domain-containing protein [Sphingopyxis sp.]
MKIYLVALGAGLLVGVIYGLMNVRSPAPPIVALVGLLGILVGEQVVPLGKRLLAGDPLTAAAVKADCADHMLGELPQRSEKRSGPSV